MLTIANNWQRIHDWYQKNTPEDTLVLADGASADEIKELETALGARLPDDVGESLALHNGAADGNEHYYEHERVQHSGPGRASLSERRHHLLCLASSRSAGGVLRRRRRRVSRRFLLLPDADVRLSRDARLTGGRHFALRSPAAEG